MDSCEQSHCEKLGRKAMRTLVAVCASGCLAMTGCSGSAPVAAKADAPSGQAASTQQATAQSKQSQTKKVKLSAPRIKSIKGVKSRAKLTFTKVKGAKTYAVYRKQDKEGATYKLIAQVKKTTYTDKNVKYLKTYKYKVQALCAGSKSKKSAARKVTVTNIDPKKKMVALTFDDGPSAHTDAIVKCLKKHKARATFFVVGSNAAYYQKAMKHAYAAGCEIGNHTYNHPQLTHLSNSSIKSQVKRTDKYIKKATGHKAALLRPPYGDTSKRVGRAVGKPQIIWSIDTLDWKTLSTSATVSHVKKHAKDGDIVLMHDIHKPTKRAALKLIPWLKKKGYQLVTVSELAEYRGVKLKDGKEYYSFKK